MHVHIGEGLEPRLTQTRVFKEYLPPGEFVEYVLAQITLFLVFLAFFLSLLNFSNPVRAFFSSKYHSALTVPGLEKICDKITDVHMATYACAMMVMNKLMVG